MSSSPSSIAPQRNDDPRKSLDDLISRAIAYHSAPELAELLAFTRRFPRRIGAVLDQEFPLENNGFSELVRSFQGM